MIESGEPREIHHMATLIGYGAAAINPYLMFESLDELADRSLLPRELSREEAEKQIVKAIGKGLLKTISKMGISTIQSYCGAQIFEAVGLDRELIDKYFTGTASRIGGVGIDVLCTEAMERHFRAYPRTARDLLPVGGVLQWRRDGELHIWSPDTIARLQHAVVQRRDRDGSCARRYAEFARLVNEEAARRGAPARADEAALRAEPIPLDEVEPATEIVKRFTHRRDEPRRARPRGARDAGDRDEPDRRQAPTPARAARTPLATCETPMATGAARRSSRSPRAASGSTLHYLVNADQLQIKMAQGAKPGEGGQLPGHKVDRTSR